MFASCIASFMLLVLVDYYILSWVYVVRDPCLESWLFVGIMHLIMVIPLFVYFSRLDSQEKPKREG